MRITKIAHRGASQLGLENTIHAIKNAIALHADVVEIDVRLTKEEIPVIIHDETINNLNVHELELKTIQSHNIPYKIGNDIFNERIPTLEEILQLNWEETGIMIEIKECPQKASVIVGKVFQILKKMTKLPKSILIGSFSLDIIQEIYNRKDQLNHSFQLIGILENLSLLDHFIKMQVDVIALWYPLITEKIIERLHALKLTVWSFTVNERADILFLKNIGLDGVISDLSPEILEKIFDI